MQRKIDHSMRRGLLYVSALGLAVVALGAGQVPETGRVIGRVRLTSRVPGKPLPSTAYPRRTVGDHDAPSLPEIRNVVVYIKDAMYRSALPAMRAELRQEHETFIPHTVAITRGSSVDFPNGDPFFHNVFSLFDGRKFDLGLYEAGANRSVKFDKAGICYIFCNIHSQMSAVVVVVDTPYFVKMDMPGEFRIEELPYGRYQLNVWAERCAPETLKAASRQITVDGPRVTLPPIQLRESRDLITVHPNKHGKDYETPVFSSPIYTQP